jgi:hypothetical protein
MAFMASTARSAATCRKWKWEAEETWFKPPVKTPFAGQYIENTIIFRGCARSQPGYHSGENPAMVHDLGCS